MRSEILQTSIAANPGSMRGIVLVPHTEHLKELRERHGADSAGRRNERRLRSLRIYTRHEHDIVRYSNKSLFEISNEIFKENLKIIQKMLYFLLALTNSKRMHSWQRRAIKSNVAWKNVFCSLSLKRCMGVRSLPENS